MMQVAQLNMSLDVTDASLKENASVSFVHLSSGLFERFSFTNSEVLLVRFCSIPLKIAYCFRAIVAT